jgi:hypothetical protein
MSRLEGRTAPLFTVQGQACDCVVPEAAGMDKFAESHHPAIHAEGYEPGSPTRETLTG